MTRNQSHGKTFEDWIKACQRFRGAADGGRAQTVIFDIEAKYDRELGLPTSVKSAKSNIIGLSDARRIWEIDEPFRIIVGSYLQDGRFKRFHTVHEFLITLDILCFLRGDITATFVTDFHDGLHLDIFPVGKHKEASAWAKAHKKANKHLKSAITLNPKIDSEDQRRLQCSIHIKKLIAATEASGNYIRHTDIFGGIVMPLVFDSTSREFNR